MNTAQEAKKGFQVVIPTANRSAKLDRCLGALEKARLDFEFPVLVCDSSKQELRDEVESVCSRYPFVELRRHSGKNVAAARNACARFASREVLVNVDDDIQVEPDAIVELAAAYEKSPKPCAVAGSVAWDGVYSRPVVMRPIGYGRAPRPGEKPSFLVGAFFAYPRRLALALPWNERIRTSDDRFMGALWRSHGVHLGFSSTARASHDPERVFYDVNEQVSHIYANLFDAIYANPSLERALSYELLGFASGARLHCRSVDSARRYISSWFRGHAALLRDRRYLKELVDRELPTELDAA